MNQLRDRGDYEGAASKIRRGLKEVIEGDALLALVRAENHRASDDERLASLRQLGIATNSLAVWMITCGTRVRGRYSSRAFPPPYSLLGRDEGPPSDDELAPLGGEAARLRAHHGVRERPTKYGAWRSPSLWRRTCAIRGYARSTCWPRTGGTGMASTSLARWVEAACVRADFGPAAAVLGRGGLRGGVAAAPNVILSSADVFDEDGSRLAAERSTSTSASSRCFDGSGPATSTWKA